MADGKIGGELPRKNSLFGSLELNEALRLRLQGMVQVDAVTGAPAEAPRETFCPKRNGKFGNLSCNAPGCDVGIDRTRTTLGITLDRTTGAPGARCKVDALLADEERREVLTPSLPFGIPLPVRVESVEDPIIARSLLKENYNHDDNYSKKRL